ncbi:MAG: phage integrase family protein [Phycisphaerales bacterium]|nr:phage integrase family protein [Phycisphaerales bacterium]
MSPIHKGAGGVMGRSRRRKPRRRFPAEVLTHDEVLALLGAVKGPTATAARNRALLAVMYRSGLRVSEALSLEVKDVDLAAGSIRVLFAKGGRARTVGVDAGALAVLRDWLAIRPDVANVGVAGNGRNARSRAALFCARGGGRLTTAYVRRLLPRLARLAGIAKRVHAHGLRHTHAAELRAEGIDIGIISKQLGHVSIATTIRYLDHIAPRAVVEAVRGREWITT